MGNALKYETDTTTPQSYSKSIFLSLYNLKAQEVISIVHMRQALGDIL